MMNYTVCYWVSTSLPAGGNPAPLLVPRFLEERTGVKVKVYSVVMALRGSQLIALLSDPVENLFRFLLLTIP
jgi:hypothetical protein